MEDLKGGKGHLRKNGLYPNTPQDLNPKKGP